MNIPPLSACLHAAAEAAAASTAQSKPAHAASHTHHVTFRSPLNKGTNGAAFGLVSFFDDHIEVRGGGPLDDLVPLEKVSAGADASATARIVTDSTGVGEMLVLRV
jgi:hypothetical protein